MQPTAHNPLDFINGKQPKGRGAPPGHQSLTTRGDS